MTERKSTTSLGHADHHVDRISRLRDSILVNILSLLPTKNSVATGVLSKRWKLLWTTVVNLDFCCPKDYTGKSAGCDELSRAEKFVGFVNYVLLIHKPGNLNRFSITWESGCIPFYVNTWITTAIIRRNVLELIVRVKNFTKLSLQVETYVFCSEILQSLELNLSICISIDIVFYLPKLKRLSLISVYFQCEEAFPKLLDGCPVLEYLVIYMDITKMIKSRGMSTFKCMISSTSLRHLELCVYHTNPKGGGLISCIVQLEAPYLRYIKLADRINKIVIGKETLNFLDEAIIQLNPFVFFEDEAKYCNYIVEVLDAFGCAKALILHDEVIRALSNATVKLQTSFDRLTRLKVTIYRNNLSALKDLIKLSNNLELLIVNMGNAKEVHTSKWKKLDNTLKTEVDSSNRKTTLDLVPMCLSNTLKRVSINGYEGLPGELAMTNYMLKHGSVMEVLRISFNNTISDSRRKLELIPQIRAFTRKSPTCEVIFS